MTSLWLILSPLARRYPTILKIMLGYNPENHDIISSFMLSFFLDFHVCILQILEQLFNLLILQI